MTETPSARRSTRRAASTRGGSATPAPSVSSRRTRAKTPKAEPLPAVATATSFAYGAPGKVSLARQIHVSSGGGGFAAAFGAARGAAVGRDVGEAEDDPDDEEDPDDDEDPGDEDAPNDEEDPEDEEDPQEEIEEEEDDEEEEVPAPAPRPSILASSRPAVPLHVTPHTITRPRIVFEEETEETYEIRSHTTAPTPATIDRAHDPSFTDVDTAFSYAGSAAGPPLSHTAASLEPPATREEIEAAQPWRIAVFWEALLRWVQIPLTSLTELSSTAKKLGILSLLSLILLATFWPTAKDGISTGNNSLYHKAGGIFSDYLPSTSFGLPFFNKPVTPDTGLVQRVETLENDVRQIRRDIRSVTRKLEGLLPENLLVQRNPATGEWEIPTSFWNALREKLNVKDTSVAWESFIAANKAKLDLAAEESVEKAASRRSQVISQEMFMERVEQVAAEVASHTATDLIRALPPAEKGATLLHNLALANIARNTELAIQTVNYFSFGLGAAVDPYLTSPTQKKPALSGIKSLIGGLFKDNAPLQALQRWEEATDCWCAAESDVKGKAQLGVILPRAIIPTSITIEHMPARGTFDIGSAPREFEVWVTNTETISQSEWAAGPVPNLSCGEAPAEHYICVGKSRYDIHGPNHIQNFALEGADLRLVNKVVVKVKNNWGRNWTCLYRIRMHGDREDSPQQEA